MWNLNFRFFYQDLNFKFNTIEEAEKYAFTVIDGWKAGEIFTTIDVGKWELLETGRRVLEFTAKNAWGSYPGKAEISNVD